MTDYCPACGIPRIGLGFNPCMCGHDPLEGLKEQNDETNALRQQVQELQSRLEAMEKRVDEQRVILKAGQESARPILDELHTLRSRLSWRPIREGRPTEPGFYAMIYMPSGPFHRDIISSKVATLAEIQDLDHFHDEWQWLGPLPITSFLVEKGVSIGQTRRCQYGVDGYAQCNLADGHEGDHEYII